jgi:hypothetical protein
VFDPCVEHHSVTGHDHCPDDVDGNSWTGGSLVGGVAVSSIGLVDPRIRLSACPIGDVGDLRNRFIGSYVRMT